MFLYLLCFLLPLISIAEKEMNDLSAFATFSRKENTYINLVISAEMDSKSVMDCSRLCMMSSTCIAFSYKNTPCLLKKLVWNLMESTLKLLTHQWNLNKIWTSHIH